MHIIYVKGIWGRRYKECGGEHLQIFSDFRYDFPKTKLHIYFNSLKAANICNTSYNLNIFKCFLVMFYHRKIKKT